MTLLCLFLHAVLAAVPGSAIASALGDEAALRAALEAEMERAMAGLVLPDAPPPWWIAYDVLQGRHHGARAELGSLLQVEDAFLRTVRVEVRTGGPDYDSSGFDAMGEPDGVVGRALPLGDDPVALRRELWLATDRAWKDAVAQLARKRAELPPERVEGPALAPAPPVVTPPALPADLDPERIDVAVRRLSALLSGLPDLERGVAVGRDWQGVRLTVDTEGTRASRPTGYAVVRVDAVLRLADGSTVRDARSWVARTAADLPSLAEMEEEVREMVAWLRAAHDAPLLEDYLGPVLLEGPAAVELFRQLAAAEFVGTVPPRQAQGPFGPAPEPRATGRVGRRLLPAGWTAVDDPLAPAAGHLVLDHEAVAAQRVVLVEDGVVRSLLTTRANPEGSNGHARALGTDRRTAMPTNVSILPRRPRSAHALRRAALRLARQAGREDVLVLRRLEPPAIAEDFDVTFSGEGPPAGLTRPLEACLLGSDGACRPVRGLSFHGADRRVLRDIVAAGAPGEPVGVLDAEPGPARFQVGALGGLPASWRVPPVVVAEMELLGRPGGEPRLLPHPDAP